MNPLDEIRRLREIAEKATPGQRRASRINGIAYLELCDSNGKVTKLIGRAEDDTKDNWDQLYWDFFHLATFSPSTVLKLLSALETSLKALEFYAMAPNTNRLVPAADGDEILEADEGSYYAVGANARVAMDSIASLLEGGK